MTINLFTGGALILIGAKFAGISTMDSKQIAVSLICLAILQLIQRKINERLDWKETNI